MVRLSAMLVGRQSRPRREHRSLCSTGIERLTGKISRYIGAQYVYSALDNERRLNRS
ncbi:hypothetical protein OK016_19680 [Vibrio chagasii]|nr:hypothetical protein [Vibrio chagasii]